MTDHSVSKPLETLADVKPDIKVKAATAGKSRMLKLLAKQIQRLKCTGCVGTVEDRAEFDGTVKEDIQTVEANAPLRKDKRNRKPLFGRWKPKKAKKEDPADKPKSQVESTEYVTEAPPIESFSRATTDDRIYRPRRRHQFFQQPYEGGFFSYFGEQELEDMVPKYNPPSLKELAANAHFDFLKNGPKRRRRRHWFFQANYCASEGDIGIFNE